MHPSITQELLPIDNNLQILWLQISYISYLQNDLNGKLKKHTSSVVEVEMTRFTRTEDDHISIFQVKAKAKFHKDKFPTFTVRNRNNNTNVFIIPVLMAPCQQWLNTLTLRTKPEKGWAIGCSFPGKQSTKSERFLWGSGSKDLNCSKKFMWIKWTYTYLNAFPNQDILLYFIHKTTEICIALYFSQCSWNKGRLTFLLPNLLYAVGSIQIASSSSMPSPSLNCKSVIYYWKKKEPLY